MLDTPDITTGRIADSRPLGRLAVAMAVLVAAVTAGAGGALAAPTGTERVEAVSDGGRLAAAALEDPGEGLQIEIREANEEYVAVEVYFPDDLFFPNDVFLGAADQFVVHENEEAVSLPEATEELVQPVEVRSIETDSEAYHGKLIYFSTPGSGAALERLADGEEVTIGLGVSTERTVSTDKWDTVTVPAT